MEKQQHTPGPWAYIVPDGYVVRHPQIYSDFGPVANATWLGENKLDQLKANARLIAAAPDLLEALEELYAVRANWIRTADHSGDDDENAAMWVEMHKARAAIARATGESK